MVFVEFSSAEKWGAMILALHATSPQLAAKKTRMNQERPIQDRMKFDLSMGLKKVLATMGTRAAFDANAYTIAFSSKMVGRVYVKDLIIKTEWLDAEWSNWKELLKDEKYKALCYDLRQKLNRAKARLPKHRQTYCLTRFTRLACRFFHAWHQSVNRHECTESLLRHCHNCLLEWPRISGYRGLGDYLAQ